MVGIVGVKALDPATSATDTSAGYRTDVIGRDSGIAFGPVPGVGGLELVGIDIGVSLSNPAGRLELPDSAAKDLSHEPIAGGHRPTVSEHGCVADHHRVAMGVSDHDVELSLRASAQQSLDLFVILRRGDHIAAQGITAPGSR